MHSQNKHRKWFVFTFRRRVREKEPIHSGLIKNGFIQSANEKCAFYAQSSSIQEATHRCIYGMNVNDLNECTLFVLFLYKVTINNNHNHIIVTFYVLQRKKVIKYQIASSRIYQANRTYVMWCHCNSYVVVRYFY